MEVEQAQPERTEDRSVEADSSEATDLRTQISERMAELDKADSSAEETVAPDDPEGDDAEEPAEEEVAADAAEEPEGDGEGEEADEEPAAYTLDEIRVSMEANPEWVNTLGKEDWKRVPKEFQPILKAQARAIQKGVESFRARQERQAPKETPKPESKPEPTKDELFLMMNDPERFDEFLEAYGQKAVNSFLKSVNLTEDQLRRFGADDTIGTAFGRAVEGTGLTRADEDAIADVISNDDRLISKWVKAMKDNDIERQEDVLSIAAERLVRQRDKESVVRSKEDDVAKQRRQSEKAKANKKVASVTSVKGAQQAQHLPVPKGTSKADIQGVLDAIAAQA